LVKLKSSKELFGNIIIPQAVFDELTRDRTPKPVKDWIDSQPQWIEVRRPSRELDDVAKALGSGEREAIALAIDLAADAILLDDKRAKNEARQRDIRVITLLNILEAAGERDLLDLSSAIDRLRDTSFYMPAEEMVEQALKRDRSRSSRISRDAEQR
jgi:predicted nucleic acid-binding protein